MKNNYYMVAEGMSEGRINHNNFESTQLKSEVKKQTLI